MPVNSVGIVTARDSLTIHWTADDAWRTVQNFAALSIEDARDRFDLGPDSQDWQIKLAQKDLKDSGLAKTKVVPVLYRPFDLRHTYYTGKPSGFHCRPRGEVMANMLAENLGFGTTRSIEIDAGWEHLFAVEGLFTHHSVSIKEVNYLFPLYLYPSAKTSLFDDAPSTAPGGRRPNIAPDFIAACARITGAIWLKDGQGSLADDPGSSKKSTDCTFGPEDIFYYAYAVFYSPGYRARYAQFLKTDFPRLPITSQRPLFAKLITLGKSLVELHLMRRNAPSVCSYPVAGDNKVEKVSFEADSPTAEVGKVCINSAQYFANVPRTVWAYQVGGYQVANKWLKDRKGRLLAFAELQHYSQVLAALAGTIALQAEIDAAIDAVGGWPMI